MPFLLGFLFLFIALLSSHGDWDEPLSWLLWKFIFVVRSCKDAACEMLLKKEAILVCKTTCLVLPLQHEWCLSICRYIWLHHDEYCWTLYSFRCGMGSYRQIHCDFCVLVEPQGTSAFFFFFPLSSTGIGKGYWLGRENGHLLLIIWLKTCTIVLPVNFWTSVYIWAISFTGCPK